MPNEQEEHLYFIAIVPPEPVLSEVWCFKEEALRLYGTSGALNSPAHITLHMPFRWQFRKMDRLEATLRAVAASVIPFRVGLSGFAGFEPRVVFVDVVPEPRLEELQLRLEDSMKRELQLFHANHRDRPFHPHM